MAKLDNKEQVLKKAFTDKDSIQEVGLALEKDATTKEKPRSASIKLAQTTLIIKSFENIDSNDLGHFFLTMLHNEFEFNFPQGF